VSYAVNCAKKLDETSTLLAAARPALVALESVAERRARLAALTARLQATLQATQRYEHEIAALQGLPSAPELVPTASLERLVARLQASQQRAALNPVWHAPSAPTLFEADRLRVFIERLTASARRVAVLQHLPESMPAVPTLHELEGLRRCGERVARARQSCLTHEAAFNETQRALAQAHEELEALKQQLGGHCPLCGSTLPEEGVEHVHAPAEAHALAGAHDAVH
jgi:DNA repair exonuclease SbcCD ATPase subunit